MEEAVYHASIGVIIFLGLLAGQRRVRSIGVTMLVGVGCAFGVDVALLILTVAWNMIAPGGLDPRVMGGRIGLLLLVGSVIGASAAIAGRRRALKAAR
jgi:hypothetical protein